MKLSEQTLRPEAVGYCFILLVSYYEQSQAPLLPPFTQSLREHLSGHVQMLGTYFCCFHKHVGSRVERDQGRGFSWTIVCMGWLLPIIHLRIPLWHLPYAFVRSGKWKGWQQKMPGLTLLFEDCSIQTLTLCARWHWRKHAALAKRDWLFFTWFLCLSALDSFHLSLLRAPAINWTDSPLPYHKESSWLSSRAAAPGYLCHNLQSNYQTI